MAHIKFFTGKFLKSEVNRFIVAGSFNTLLCYLIFIIFLFAGLDKTYAMTIATIVTIFISFFLMGHYVFVSEFTFKRALYFLIMQSVAYAINISLLKVITWAGVLDYVAGIVSLLLTAAFTYLVTKYVVFFKSTASIN